MNEIIRQIFGNSIASQKPKKQKRTKLIVLAITEQGGIIGKLECLPTCKEATILEAFNSYPNATILNVISLNNRTKVIHRQFEDFDQERKLDFDVEDDFSPEEEENDQWFYSSDYQ